MSELERLLAQYGQGYQPDRGQDSLGYLLQGPAPPVTTAEINAAYPRFADSFVTRPMRGTAEGMRWLARGPEDTPPVNAKLMPFLLNAAAGGLDSSANWLDGRPQVGPDTLAPLGLAGMGVLPGMMRGAASHAVERVPKEWGAPHVAEHAYEWPVEAAVKVGDRIFTGPNHIDGVMKAQAALGDDVFSHRLQGATQHGIEDGFVTNTGRYVTREEAGRLADERNQTNHFTTSWLTGRPKKGMDTFLGEALENYDPKTGKQIFADAKGSLLGTVVNAVEQSSKPTLSADVMARMRAEIVANPEYADVIRASYGRGVPEASTAIPAISIANSTKPVSLGSNADRAGYHRPVPSDYTPKHQKPGTWPPEAIQHLLSMTNAGGRTQAEMAAEIKTRWPQLTPTRQSISGLLTRARRATDPERDVRSSTTGLPLPPQEPDDLASMLAQYGVP